MLFNAQEERRNRQQEEYRIRFRQRATLLGIGLIFLVTAVLLIVGQHYSYHHHYIYDVDDAVNLYGVDDGYTNPHETTMRTISWTLTLLLINVRPLCAYEGILLVHLRFFDG